MQRYGKLGECHSVLRPKMCKIVPTLFFYWDRFPKGIGKSLGHLSADQLHTMVEKYLIDWPPRRMLVTRNGSSTWRCEEPSPKCFYWQRDTVTMFATGKVTNERWTCAGEGFVLMTTTNLSAMLREPSLSSERWKGFAVERKNLKEKVGTIIIGLYFCKC